MAAVGRLRPNGKSGNTGDWRRSDSVPHDWKNAMGTVSQWVI